jgi:NADH-quinone oxidoreductase subunit K
MMDIGMMHYVVVGTLLFLIGMVGVLTRRNIMIIFMCVELMMVSVNLNLLAFSRLYGLQGQVFGLFVAADAAAEAAIGLGILIAFFRNRTTVNVDEVDLLKW